MINPIAPLSNSASTITPSYISIFSSLIFTVTSLSISSLFRLQQVVLFITLESIVNIFLLLRLNQELLSLGPHLNYIHSLPQPIFAVHYSYYSYILVLFFPNSVFYSLIPTVSCHMTKFPTIVIISISLIHLHDIEIPLHFFSSASLSLQGVSNHHCICHFYLFYQSRFFLCPLYLLPLRPNLGREQKWSKFSLIISCPYLPFLSLISFLLPLNLSFFLLLSL